MATPEMIVRYRGTSGTQNGWVVFEPSLMAVVSAASPFAPKDRETEVYFDMSAAVWICGCKPDQYQTTENLPFCDHVVAVCRNITSTQGPWEQYKTLMGSAWGVLQSPSNKKRERYASGGVARMVDQETYKKMIIDRYKDGTASFMIEIMNGMSSDTTAGTNATSTANNERDWKYLGKARYTIDDPFIGVDVSADVKDVKIKRKPKEPEHPKPPKKPKSRFSEIDL